MFSPDGTRIAFSSFLDGNNGIGVMNADGTNQTNLTHNHDSFPVFSPDGTRILFTSSRDGFAEIYVMNADGSDQTNLTHNPAVDSSGVFSPDGTRIAFMSERDGTPHIYVMNADGSNPTRLAAGFNPVFSPDGSHIAFITERDGNREIYAMNTDGTNQTNLTHNPADEFNPNWGIRVTHPTTTATSLGVTPASPAAASTTEMLKATVSPSEATGSVQFKDGNTNLGSPVAVSGGTGSMTTTLDPGTHQLAATFAPTDPTNLAESTSTPLTYVVNPATPIPSPTPPGGPLRHGQHQRRVGGVFAGPHVPLYRGQAARHG